MKKGYLIFTTHDRDEVDATFVPETETELISFLDRDYSGREHDDETMKKFNDWLLKMDELKIKPERWFTQTRCKLPWPFNNHEILGTFYHLVY